MVVDEAQDLMNFDSLDHLEGAINGGWSEGRWVMFLDQNRQAHLYGDFDPDALAVRAVLQPGETDPAVQLPQHARDRLPDPCATPEQTPVWRPPAPGPQVEFVTVDDQTSGPGGAGSAPAPARRHDVSTGCCHHRFIAWRLGD